MELRIAISDRSEFSKARLAAEAAFAPPPQPLPPSCDPLVIVKRKRATGLESAQPSRVDDRGNVDGPSVGDEPEVVRAPRVIRVDTPVFAYPVPQSASVAIHEPSLPNAAPAQSEVAAEEPTRPRSKSRKSLSSAVTVTRPGMPQAPSPLPADEPPSTFEDASDPAEARRTVSDSKLKAAQRRMSLPGQYPLLLVKIEALERQARKLKQIESAQAVRWIKRTMVEYGLTVQDIGL